MKSNSFSLSVLAVAATFGLGSMAHARGAGSSEGEGVSSNGKAISAKAMEIGNKVSAAANTKLPKRPGEMDLETLILKAEKAMNRNVVIDPGVRGSVVVYDSLPSSPEHLHREMMVALAINGFTVVESGGSDLIMSARNAGRLAPLTDKLPPESDEKIVSWVIQLKKFDGEYVNKSLRALSSKDGELSVTSDSKKLLLTDFVSNAYRTQELIDALEDPSIKLAPNPKFAAEGLVLDSEKKVKFDFKSEELTKILQTLSPMLNKTLVLSPAVRGRVTIQNGGPVTQAEAYRSVLSALQINGYSVVVQGEFLRVESARNVHRQHIELLTQLPSVLENRMVTYILRMPGIDTQSLFEANRYVASKDGEIISLKDQNTIIFSDFMPTVDRAVKIFTAFKEVKPESSSKPSKK